MNEYKVENYRHPELKLRADSQFKGREEGQRVQRRLSKTFQKKEKKPTKENNLSRKEEGKGTDSD